MCRTLAKKCQNEAEVAKFKETSICGGIEQLKKILYSVSLSPFVYSYCSVFQLFSRSHAATRTLRGLKMHTSLLSNRLPSTYCCRFLYSLLKHSIVKLSEWKLNGVFGFKMRSSSILASKNCSISSNKARESLLLLDGLLNHNWSSLES